MSDSTNAKDKQHVSPLANRIMACMNLNHLLAKLGVRSAANSQGAYAWMMFSIKRTAKLNNSEKDSDSGGRGPSSI